MKSSREGAKSANIFHHEKREAHEGLMETAVLRRFEPQMHTDAH